MTKAIERLKVRAHHAARIQHSCNTHAARSTHASSRACAADSRRAHSTPAHPQACKGKNSQNRLENFFGKPTIIPCAKRKEPEKGAKGAKGKLKGGSSSAFKKGKK